MTATTPREVLAALAAAVAADPARWPGRDGYQPGPGLDGLRDGEWLHVLPAAWKRITGQPGVAVLAVLHGRGDLAVPDSTRRRGEWAVRGPRWAGQQTGYRVRLAAVEDPPPDPAPAPAPGSDPVPQTAADPELALMWAQMPDWRGEIFWRPDEDAGPCPACGTVRDAEPGRTTVFCPLCRTLADYPEVTAYRQQQHASGGPGRRQGAVAASPAELARQADEERRAVRRARRDLLAPVEHALGDKRLTSDARSDLEDFQQQLSAATTMERVGQLGDQLRDYVIARRSLFGRRADLDAYDDDGEIIEGEIVEDWEDGEDQAETPGAEPGTVWRPPGLVKAMSAIVTGPLALTRGQDYSGRDAHLQPPQLEYCAACGAPAPLRVNSSAPTLQQLAAAGGTLPVTVCAEHWPQLRAAGGPGDWHVEDLTRGHLPGGPGRDRATVQTLESTPRPGDSRPVNPTIEISGREPRREAFAWSS